MKKAERLVNLFALLMETARPLTVDEIRRKIPGYHGQEEGAFRRMFERDKEELREIGVPVDLVPTDAWEAEQGYLISKDEAILDDPGLTPDEQTALWLAARAWGGEVGGGNPTTALLKLAVAGGGAEPGPGGWMMPWVDTSEPNLAPLVDAVARRKRVEFDYRTGGGGPPERRAVDPYGLRYRGAWYVAGFDHGRGALRQFKLARIEGAVRVAPGKGADFDRPTQMPADLPHGPWEGEQEATATVAFSPEAAWWAERRTRASRTAERRDGWVEMTMPVADVGRFAAWILGFGEDAEVASPPELRAEVVRRLEALAGPATGEPKAPGKSPRGAARRPKGTGTRSKAKGAG